MSSPAQVVPKAQLQHAPVESAPCGAPAPAPEDPSGGSSLRAGGAGTAEAGAQGRGKVCTPCWQRALQPQLPIPGGSLTHRLSPLQPCLPSLPPSLTHSITQSPSLTRVIHDDCVGTLQVEAHTAGADAEQEDKHAAACRHAGQPGVGCVLDGPR